MNTRTRRLWLKGPERRTVRGCVHPSRINSARILTVPRSRRTACASTAGRVHARAFGGAADGGAVVPGAEQLDAWQLANIWRGATLSNGTIDTGRSCVGSVYEATCHPLKRSMSSTASRPSQSPTSPPVCSCGRAKRRLHHQLLAAQRDGRGGRGSCWSDERVGRR